MKSVLRETAVWVLLGAITASWVYLVQQNRALEDRNRMLARRAIEPHAGLFVPSYPVTTLTGIPVTLGAVGHRQVLVFFRTTCPYCRASTQAFNAIAERLAPHSQIPVYGVAMDSAPAARAYAAEHGLRFPIIAQQSPRLVGLYRISSVPLILVVNEQGRLAYARLGLLQSATAVDSVVTAAQDTLPVTRRAPNPAAPQARRPRLDPY